MGVKLVSASGGSVELAAPTTASNYTLTVPATTATVAIDGPAFSVSMSGAQTLSNLTITVNAFDTKAYDTANCFNATGSTVGGIPAYSFLPNVAGTYLFTFYATVGATSSATYGGGYIQKNGSNLCLVAVPSTFSSTASYAPISMLIYMNGTTDYVSFASRIQGTGTLTATTAAFASGALVRSS